MEVEEDHTLVLLQSKGGKRKKNITSNVSKNKWNLKPILSRLRILILIKSGKRLVEPITSIPLLVLKNTFFITIGLFRSACTCISNNVSLRSKAAYISCYTWAGICLLLVAHFSAAHDLILKYFMKYARLKRHLAGPPTCAIWFGSAPFSIFIADQLLKAFSIFIADQLRAFHFVAWIAVILYSVSHGSINIVVISTKGLFTPVCYISWVLADDF